MVDFPLAGQAARGLGLRPAVVERWIPIRPDQTGDIALLRLREPVPGTHPLPLADPGDMWKHPARAVGFTGGEPTAKWFDGVLGGTTEEGWVQLSRASGQTQHVEEGFSGGPVWDEELDAVIGLVVVAQTARETQQAFVLRTGTILRELPELETVLLPDSPFRGLSALGEEDANVFFGRDDEVDRVVEALRGGRTPVTVYGPSGCGKSSLVLAGVVPRIRQQGHEVVVLDAGHLRFPHTVLATELAEMARSGRFGEERARRADPDQIGRWLGDFGIADTLHRVTGRQDTNLLVVLDQAEALLNRPEPEIDQSLALLFPEHGTDGLRVLVTLRADFMAAALSHPELGPALRRGSTLPLTPMGRKQLREVITKPLSAIPSVEYDPGLDQRILDDAGHTSGALPLLGFVLAELWDRRSGGRLRTEAYEDLGRVSGALRHHAEDVWGACVKPGEEQQARRLLTGLVRVLPGGEAPLRRVLTREEVGDQGWELAQDLAHPRRRLLVLHGGDGHPESVELSHEALITEWPELVEEVKNNADFLAVRAEVQHDLERWQRAERSGDLLLGRRQLEAVEGRLRDREAELTGEQREFLGLARRRQVRIRTGWITSGIAGALVVSLIVGLTVFLSQVSSARAEREAEGLSRSLAIQSDELMPVNPVQAALVALTAYETAPTQEARSALMRRYLAFQQTEWVLSGVEGPIQEVAMSADGAVTLARTATGRATLFVRTDEGELRQEQLGLRENALVPSVSRDGRRIAYVQDVDGTVVWHDVLPQGEHMLGPPNQLEGAMTDISLGISFSGDIRVMDFSPDARLLVGTPAADSDQPVQVWDLETGQPRALLEDTPRLREVWFGPDEDTLMAVVADPDFGRVVAIDVSTGRVRDLAEDIDAEYVGVSGDGSVVVICRREEGDSDEYGFSRAHYRAVRVADGEVLVEHSPSEYSNCGDPAVSEQGEHFVVPGLEDEWELVDTSGAEEVRQVVGPQRLLARGHLPLLGTASDPVIVTQEENTITGWRMPGSGGFDVHGSPRLLGDGGAMVLRVGPEGQNLRVEETESGGRTLGSVDRDFAVPADPNQEIQVNPA